MDSLLFSFRTGSSSARATFTNSLRIDSRSIFHTLPLTLYATFATSQVVPDSRNRTVHVGSGVLETPAVPVDQQKRRALMKRKMTQDTQKDVKSALRLSAKERE